MGIIYYIYHFSIHLKIESLFKKIESETSEANVQMADWEDEIEY